METKSIRVFYRKSDGEVVWSHELRGTGKFPTSVASDLAGISGQMPDGLTPLGGFPGDYACIEVDDTVVIEGFLASDSNKAVDGKLVTGTPRPVLPAVKPRDLAAELDAVAKRLSALGG